MTRDEIEQGDTVQLLGKTGPGDPIGTITAVRTHNGERKVSVAFTGQEPIWCRPGTLVKVQPQTERAAPAPTLAEDVVAPQPATDRYGSPLMLHGCGRVASSPGGVQSGPCTLCGRQDGWQALYVLPGGAA
jgi:hypothetical protein